MVEEGVIMVNLFLVVVDEGLIMVNSWLMTVHCWLLMVMQWSTVETNQKKRRREYTG